MEKDKSDPFWFDDMSILFSKDRLVEFFPTEDMSLGEKLNSIIDLLYESVFR